MDNWKDKIRVLSDNDKEITDSAKKSKIIDEINGALEKDREFLDHECLFGNLKDYLKDMRIRIWNRKKHYEIDLDPVSGEGHDFFFNIDKKSNRLDMNSFCVGEIESEPEDDEY